MGSIVRLSGLDNGKSSPVAGVIVRDGKIAALYVFLDPVQSQRVTCLRCCPRSREASPVVTAALGHEERFPPARLNAGCGFRKETIAGMRRNWRDAPIPDLPVLLPERGGSTLMSHS